MEYSQEFKDKCNVGNHDLIKIYETGNDMSSEVVRWCRICGAIVIDGDFDGRTNPGQVMKMKYPKQVYK